MSTIILNDFRDLEVNGYKLSAQVIVKAKYDFHYEPMDDNVVDEELEREGLHTGELGVYSLIAKAHIPDLPAIKGINDLHGIVVVEANDTVKDLLTRMEDNHMIENALSDLNINLKIYKKKLDALFTVSGSVETVLEYLEYMAEIDETE